MKNRAKLWAGLALLCMCEVAFAAGGIQKVNTLMQSVQTALYAVSAIVVTIAIMWAGFKIAFQGNTLREAAPPLLGGIIIGAASGIAGLLVA